MSCSHADISTASIAVIFTTLLPNSPQFMSQTRQSSVRDTNFELLGNRVVKMTAMGTIKVSAYEQLTFRPWPNSPKFLIYVTLAMKAYIIS